MEGVHGYESSICKEEDNLKVPCYIHDWMGKKGRNDIESLNMVIERYGLEVRQVICVKREYHSTSNFHTNISQLK